MTVTETEETVPLDRGTAAVWEGLVDLCRNTDAVPTVEVASALVLGSVSDGESMKHVFAILSGLNCTQNIVQSLLLFIKLLLPQTEIPYP